MKGTLFTLMAILAAVQSVADVGQDCRNLYRLTDLIYAVEPGRPIPAQGDRPEHCRVRAVFTRPLYAYPMLAKYRGMGNASLAENFECK